MYFIHASHTSYQIPCQFMIMTCEPLVRLDDPQNKQNAYHFCSRLPFAHKHTSNSRARISNGTQQQGKKCKRAKKNVANSAVSSVKSAHTPPIKYDHIAKQCAINDCYAYKNHIVMCASSCLCTFASLARNSFKYVTRFL